MKIRTIRWTICAAGLVGLFLLGSSGVSCTQPELLCNVTSSPFDPYIAQYIPKDPASNCLALPGEFIGMKTYNPPLEDGKNVDASKTSVAVQAIAVGQLTDDGRAAGAVDSDQTHTQFSLGDFSNTPNADDFCSAPDLSAAEQHIPRTDYTDAEGNAQVFPETRLKYEWKDLQVYMTFAAPGSAATGEVTITREVTDPTTGTTDSCTTTYVANALFPAVGCEVTDAMGAGTGMPDDTRCCSKADLANGRPFGSGINPDFKVKCDPTLLLCVLDWKPGEAFPPTGTSSACGG